MWRGHCVEGYYDTRWLTGLWSTQAKVEDIVPNAAWHWVTDSSVVNDPRGEPGRTPLHLGLPSAWGPLTETLCFPRFEGQLLNWGL